MAKQPKLDAGLVKDAREYAEMHSERKRHQREVDKLGAKMAELEERLSEAFISAGVSLVKTDVGTVHVREETWPALIVAEGEDKNPVRRGAVMALEAMGHGNMITFNQQSARALVRELADDEGRLPPPLGNYLRAEVRHRIGVRGSGE